ncbi:MAG: OsmC family peroxiredoxin [Porticoccaceae bacterium]|jgi:organic hydroperoxide reductase OsmC/OhrA|nr:OsmC family peroxiredoxin [Porticoccaceae bacterium]
MSEHLARIEWKRQSFETFVDNKYSRAHRWEFDGGISLAASASPLIVPTPYSVEANVDPEEAFVASLSSCHMLFFLSFAAQNQYVVESYSDSAKGKLGKDNLGKTSMTEVWLRPVVIFSGDRVPSRDKIESMHHQSHDRCFIANSVKTKVVIELGD